jgi:hypothetical protein
MLSKKIYQRLFLIIWGSALLMMVSLGAIAACKLPGKYPEASCRLLKNSDVAKRPMRQLRIMKSEIYARHGYIFKTETMKNYFNRQPWYEPRYPDIRDIFRKLNRTEGKNISFIKRHMRRK